MLKNKLTVAGVCLLFVSFSSHAASIVYNVDRVIGDTTVIGTIETDGTIGALASGNLVSWDLTLLSPSINGGAPVALTVLNNSGDAFIATESQLLFDFDGASTGNWTGFTAPGNSPWWCLAASTSSSCGGVAGAENVGPPVGADFVEYTGLQTIAAVPVPAAVWLFGTALVGLFGVARKQRS